MRIHQALWTEEKGWNGQILDGADIALAFGSPAAISNDELWNDMSARYPGAILMGCSTGGEIHGADVLDDSLSLTALAFSRTKLRSAEAMVQTAADSRQAGRAIGEALADDALRTVLVLSDGLHVNGSALIMGIREAVSPDVVITGGLAGDGARFATTYVGLNHRPVPGCVAAAGFYGNAIRVGHGSAGGWDVFGPERYITRSKGNVLFELDGKPALDLYKHYLGEEADKLPGSALLFPLRVSPPGRRDASLTRTIVSVDEERRAMIFAGDVPEGYRAQLMRGNFDRLIEGAADAAHQVQVAVEGERVAILVSCVGRKLLLGQRIGEEVDAVRDVLGDIPVAGFYSYGEVSPHAATHCAELHNQTMTITVLGETGRA